MPRRRISQAVVFIHGIGEQKPMDTLRGFVTAILPEPKSGPQYFSKPDTMSQLFELRKLQNRTQPRTHFYEYYWASRVKGTKLSHVLNWLSSLLLRWPNTVPAHMLSLWILTWGLVAASVGCWLWFSLQSGSPAVLRNPPLWLSVLATLGLVLLQWLVIHYVGDAARYLSPRPGNIALRQQIRSDGIELLRRLHDSGKYERIIVVGHSLGSVIGYDILTHLWQEMNDVYDTPRDTEQPRLSQLEDTGEALPASPTQAQLRAYQEHQVKLWHELRSLGNPWRVTDFITMGSPLVHAAVLLAHDSDDLTARQQQRELPTCPPTPEVERDSSVRYSYRVWDKYKSPDGEHVLRALHHAALFAATRWTNLYFPVRMALFGDFVGGPLRKWFGRGVVDRPVTDSRWFRRNTPSAHVSYWSGADEGEGSSLGILKSALDAEGVRTFSAADPAQPTTAHKDGEEDQ